MSTYKSHLNSTAAIGIYFLAMGIGKFCTDCFTVYVDTDKEHEIECEQKKELMKVNSLANMVLGITKLNVNLLQCDVCSFSIAAAVGDFAVGHVMNHEWELLALNGLLFNYINEDYTSKFKPVLNLNPKKVTTEDWNRLHGTMISTA